MACMQSAEDRPGSRLYEWQVQAYGSTGEASLQTLKRLCVSNGPYAAHCKVERPALTRWTALSRRRGASRWTRCCVCRQPKTSHTRPTTHMQHSASHEQSSGNQVQLLWRAKQKPEGAQSLQRRHCRLGGHISRHTHRFLDP